MEREKLRRQLDGADRMKIAELEFAKRQELLRITDEIAELKSRETKALADIEVCVASLLGRMATRGRRIGAPACGVAGPRGALRGAAARV